MDSLLDDSTSSAGGILQSGTVTKVVEEEECQHHANAPTTGIDATSAASTKIAISKDKGDTLSPEVQKKVLDAFEVFDHEQNKTVDAREIGTIIRSLGYCPSEAEIQEVLRDMEDPQEMGYISVDRFYPVMSKIIMQQRYQLLHSEELLKAFQALDTESKGHLTIDEAKNFFTRHGEAFAQEEIDEMLNAAVDANTKTIPYRTFVHFLTIEPND